MCIEYQLVLGTGIRLAGGTDGMLGVNRDAEFRPECGQQAALPEEHSREGRKLMVQRAGEGWPSELRIGPGEGGEGTTPVSWPPACHGLNTRQPIR